MYAHYLEIFPQDSWIITKAPAMQDPIGSREDFKERIGQFLSKYMAILRDSHLNCNIIFRQNENEIGAITNIERAPNLKNIKFKVYERCLQDLELEDCFPYHERKKRKSKKKDADEDQITNSNNVLEISLVDLYSKGGHLDYVAYPVMYTESRYIPEGMNRRIGAETISTWNPSPFFMACFHRPERHSAALCKYRLTLECYDALLDYLVENMDEWGSIAKMCPELESLQLLFELCHVMSEGKAPLTEYTLRWIAFLIYSGEPTQTAIVLYNSVQGIGKSTLIKLIQVLMKNNFMNLKNETLHNDRFSGHQDETQLIVCEEVQAMEKKGSALARKFYDNLKNRITNADIVSEKKNMAYRNACPVHSFIFSTNNIPGFFYDKSDRRGVVYHCSTELIGKTDKWKKIFDALNLTVDDEFKIHGCSQDTTEFKRLDCCDAPSTTPRKDYLALMSMFFFKLHIRNCNENWAPYKNPPLTRIHVQMQLGNDPLLEMLIEFVDKKCNNAASKDAFKCFKTKCKDSMEDHFDPDYPSWQLSHVQLPSLESKDYKTLKAHPELYGLKAETVYTNLGWVYYFDFPPYEEFKDFLDSKLDVTNRVRVE